MLGSHKRSGYDFVIVGGGSAGCVLANRLSADPSCHVLLLEAGGWDRNPLVRIPAGMAKLPKKYNWNYDVAPDRSRAGITDPWAAGKVLGGGSSINMMFWVRGCAADFDGWRDLGCPGWGFEEVLPYFERSEAYAKGPSPLRGTDGPIGVTEIALDVEVIDDFVAAAQSAGHALNPDYNGPEQLGVSIAQVSQRRGFRSSTSRGYLAPVRSRPNLEIRTGATVSNIEWDGDRAVGVSYRDRWGFNTVRGCSEVILSAGALASPKLLLASGVGPADQLRKLGIEVRHDAPQVGRNLQEHPYGMLLHHTDADTLYEELHPVRAARHALEFVRHGRGALTMSGAAAVVFGQTVGAHPTESEIIMLPLGISLPERDVEEGVEHDVHDVTILPHGVCLYPSHVHPRSRGTISLTTADPAAPALIEHDMFAEPQDMQALVAACRQAREIMDTPLMKEKAFERLPGPGVQTDREWADYLRSHAFRANHPVGTARMGSDDEAVVDPVLRVNGVRGLRVVDASIFPVITSGNTNAPTIMVAERAAGFIVDGS